MATGMKIWAGVLVVSAALVSYKWLPPEPLTVPQMVSSTEAEVRARALRSQLVETNGIIKRMDWSEEYTRALVENAVDGLAVRAEGSMTQEAVDGYRAALQEQLSLLPTRDPEAIVGSFWVDRHSGGHPDVRDARLEDHREYYVGTLETGEPYCFVLKPEVENGLTDRALRWRRFDTSPWLYTSGLGACRITAEYGAPGERIAAWLDEGALLFAQTRKDPSRSYDEWRYRRRGPFGASFRYVNQRVEVDQCLGGMSEVCLDQVLNPRWERVEPDAKLAIIEASPMSTMERPTSLSSPGGWLFHDLETEFGVDAFRAFWKSDQDVRPAFEAAFGVDMEEWVMGWVDRTFAQYKPGPGLTRTARFGGLLVIVLFGIIAGGINRRRKVA